MKRSAGCTTALAFTGLLLGILLSIVALNTYALRWMKGTLISTRTVQIDGRTHLLTYERVTKWWQILADEDDAFDHYADVYRLRLLDGTTLQPLGTQGQAMAWRAGCSPARGNRIWCAQEHAVWLYALPSLEILVDGTELGERIPALKAVHQFGYDAGQLLAMTEAGVTWQVDPSTLAATERTAWPEQAHEFHWKTTPNLCRRLNGYRFEQGKGERKRLVGPKMPTGGPDFLQPRLLCEQGAPKEGVLVVHQPTMTGYDRAISSIDTHGDIAWTYRSDHGRLQQVAFLDGVVYLAFLDQGGGWGTSSPRRVALHLNTGQPVQ